MEDTRNILYYVRFLALAVSAFLTVVFAIMSLVSGFRHTKHGFPTKKTIRVAGMYLGLTFVSAMLTLVILDTGNTLAALVGLGLGLVGVALFVGASYFGLMVADKGLDKIFAPAWQFLKRLFSRNSD